jgi:hypothetical protein
MERYKKLIILILGILIIQSCTFTRIPKDYPLIVTSIHQSIESEYDIYVIKDYNPNTVGWGKTAMYIELKDERYKFKLGDTVIFSKK